MRTATLIRSCPVPLAQDPYYVHAMLAAHLAPSTIFSHRSAAVIWRLALALRDAIEVTTPAGVNGACRTTRVNRAAVTAHRCIVPIADRTVIDGLPVTTLARTWVDLAAALDPLELIAAGDSALRAGMSLDSLPGQIAAARGRRGVSQARRCVGLLDARARSRPESRIRAALVLAGLPAPRVNEAIVDRDGTWLAEPDLHYPEARLILDFDGADHASPERMRRDARRILDLQRAGWEVRIYTTADAVSRIDEVVAEVRILLRRRAPWLLGDAAASRRAVA